MKKQLLSLLAILIAGFMNAQTAGINYKALITENGTALNAQSLNIRFTIIQNGSYNVYQEIQSTLTDTNGIISVQIGEGSVISGDFNAIDWSNGEYFLKVEINTGSGYTDFGTTAFKYVPYAKYAETAGNTFSGDFNDLSNVPAGLSDGDDDTHLSEAQVDAYVANNGYLTSEVDGSTTNELQTITKNGSTVTLSHSGGSFTDEVNDPDSDPTNEFQTLSFDNNTRQLTISNGNMVTIPAGSATGGDGWGSQVAATDNTINGDGTSVNPLGVNINASVFDDWDKDASDDFSGSFNDLTDVPAGLSDGDDVNDAVPTTILLTNYKLSAKAVVRLHYPMEEAVLPMLIHICQTVIFPQWVISKMQMMPTTIRITK